jgi:hypothetical protein
MSANRLYLDHAATTPVVPAARVAMAEALANWANPSSPHSEGRSARAALENARERIKAALGWDGELIFTSGASEAIALALRGFDSVASAVEHDAVLSAVGPEMRLAVDASGIVDLPKIAGARRHAIQYVNNETGVIQPLELLGDRIRADAGLLFADCSQSAGKLPLPNADMIALSAEWGRFWCATLACLPRQEDRKKDTGAERKICQPLQVLPQHWKSVLSGLAKLVDCASYLTIKSKPPAAKWLPRIACALRPLPATACRVFPHRAS